MRAETVVPAVSPVGVLLSWVVLSWVAASEDAPAWSATELTVVTPVPVPLVASARDGAARPTSRSPPVMIPTAVSLRPFLMIPLLKAVLGRS